MHSMHIHAETESGIIFSTPLIIGISTGLTSLVCLLSILIIVVIAAVFRRKKRSGNKTISKDTGISMVINNSERSPSPVYMKKLTICISK